MKILLDINVVLDLFLEREPFFQDVYKIFEAIETRRIEGFLCASSIDTIHYLIAKTFHKKRADEVVIKLLKIFDIAEVNKTTILEALSGEFEDFEDSIIYASAYLHQLDYIITRDKKGFKNSKIPFLTPAEFRARLIS